MLKNDIGCIKQYYTSDERCLTYSSIPNYNHTKKGLKRSQDVALENWTRYKC